MKRYEDFVGLTDVKGAQARVVKYEKKFIETQELRRESQSKITDIQKKIKVINNDCFLLQLLIFEHRIFIWNWKRPIEERTDILC